MLKITFEGNNVLEMFKPLRIHQDNVRYTLELIRTCCKYILRYVEKCSKSLLKETTC